LRFENAVEEVGPFGVADRLDHLREHIPTSWIEAALNWTGTASIRRRRLPADQVVWLVICMALLLNESIERIVDMFGLALPDQDDTKVAKSTVTQARQRLGDEPLAQLFAMTAKTWARRSADANHWRGLALYGWDGTTTYVPDSPENRVEFGEQKAAGGRGESGYPQVRPDCRRGDAGCLPVCFASTPASPQQRRGYDAQTCNFDVRTRRRARRASAARGDVPCDEECGAIASIFPGHWAVAALGRDELKTALGEPSHTLACSPCDESWTLRAGKIFPRIARHQRMSRVHRRRTSSLARSIAHMRCPGMNSMKER